MAFRIDGSQETQSEYTKNLPVYVSIEIPLVTALSKDSMGVVPHRGEPDVVQGDGVDGHVAATCKILFHARQEGVREEEAGQPEQRGWAPLQPPGQHLQPLQLSPQSQNRETGQLVSSSCSCIYMPLQVFALLLFLYHRQYLVIWGGRGGGAQDITSL